MKNLLVLFSLISIFLASSCSTGNHISSDFEKNANFPAYKSYKILEHRECYQEIVNPINKQRITRAINQEMSKLNYAFSEDPDLYVSWYVVIRDVKEVDLYKDYYGWWRYQNHEQVYYYKEGTLVIDLIDAKNRQVVWHGKASGRVYEEMPDVEEKINAAIQSMFIRYVRDKRSGKNIAYN